MGGWACICPTSQALDKNWKPKMFLTCNPRWLLSVWASRWINDNKVKINWWSTRLVSWSFLWAHGDTDRPAPSLDLWILRDPYTLTSVCSTCPRHVIARWGQQGGTCWCHWPPDTHSTLYIAWALLSLRGAIKYQGTYSSGVSGQEHSLRPPCVCWTLHPRWYTPNAVVELLPHRHCVGANLTAP